MQGDRPALVSADIADQGFLQSVALGEGVVWTKTVNEAVYIEANAAAAIWSTTMGEKMKAGVLHVFEGGEDCGTVGLRGMEGKN